MKISKYITACLFFILTVTLNMLIAPNSISLHSMESYVMRTDDPTAIDIALMEQVADQHNVILCTEHTRQQTIIKSTTTFFIAE